MAPKIDLWTDGSGTTSGPGGWAYILRYVNPSTGELFEREGAGGMREATNNRAELTAVIEGLLALNRPSEVLVHTDSELVVNIFTRWIDGWIARGWRKATKPDRAPEIAVQCPVCFAVREGESGVCVFHDQLIHMVAPVEHKAVKNRDLLELLVQAQRIHKVRFVHVKGHAGVDLNERCDKLAGAERRKIIDARAVAA